MNVSQKKILIISVKKRKISPLIQDKVVPTLLTRLWSKLTMLPEEESWETILGFWNELLWLKATLDVKLWLTQTEEYGR